ncbi:MAG TPA: hypothetical protein VHS55_08340, partial [Solirubrobacteraceae bacterium]|nr:hypothetical protein [Solirubrobacteraceae bacterium]
MSGTTPDAPLAPAVRVAIARRRRAALRLPRLDGAGAVWCPAAIVGAIVVGLIVWQVTIPRDFYTGTNSVGV